MPKINKDFSDALGFRLLSCYQSFVNDYPVEGAKIQKLYDAGFTETCFKCYPIIAEAGVDPALYEAKVKPTTDLKTVLRDTFPIKQVTKSPETIDKKDATKTASPPKQKPVSQTPIKQVTKSPADSSDEDSPDEDSLDEEDPIIKELSPKQKPVVILPKMIPRNQVSKQPEMIDLTDEEDTSKTVMEPKREHVSLSRPSPLQPVRCSTCEKLRLQVSDLEAANNKVIKLNKEQAEVNARLNDQIKQQAEVNVRLNEQIKQLNSIVSSKNSIIVKHQQTISDLQISKNMNLRTISFLEKENQRVVGLFKQFYATANDLDQQIEASKKRKQ